MLPSCHLRVKASTPCRQPHLARLDASPHWPLRQAEKLMDLEEVYQAALRAKAAGSTRFCMGAAWRGPSQVRPRV